MNEEALKDAYSLFTQSGYSGSQDEFYTLLSDNAEAFADSYALFKGSGYKGSEDNYKELLGLKKKDSSALQDAAAQTASGDTPSTSDLSQSSLEQDVQASLEERLSGFRDLPEQEKIKIAKQEDQRPFYEAQGVDYDQLLNVQDFKQQELEEINEEKKADEELGFFEKMYKNITSTEDLEEDYQTTDKDKADLFLAENDDKIKAAKIEYENALVKSLAKSSQSPQQFSQTIQQSGIDSNNIRMSDITIDGKESSINEALDYWTQTENVNDAQNEENINFSITVPDPSDPNYEALKYVENFMNKQIESGGRVGDIGQNLIATFIDIGAGAVEQLEKVPAGLGFKPTPLKGSEEFDNMSAWDLYMQEGGYYANKVRDYAEHVRDKIRVPEEQSIIKATLDGNFDDMFFNTANGVANAIPFTLAIGLAAPVVGPTAALLGGGGAAAGMKSLELKERRRKGEDIENWQIYLSEGVTWATESFFEQYTLKIINQARKAGGSKAIVDPGKLLDSYVNGIKKSMFIEGSSEVATEGTQYLSDAATGLEEFNAAEFAVRMVDTGIISTLFGGGMYLTTRGATDISRNLNTINDNTSVIFTNEKGETKEVSRGEAINFAKDPEIAQQIRDGKLKVDYSMNDAAKQAIEDLVYGYTAPDAQQARAEMFEKEKVVSNLSRKINKAKEEGTEISNEDVSNLAQALSEMESEGKKSKYNVTKSTKAVRSEANKVLKDNNIEIVDAVNSQNTSISNVTETVEATKIDNQKQYDSVKKQLKDGKGKPTIVQSQNQSGVRIDGEVSQTSDITQGEFKNASVAKNAMKEFEAKRDAAKRGEMIESELFPANNKLFTNTKKETLDEIPQEVIDNNDYHILTSEKEGLTEQERASRMEELKSMLDEADATYYTVQGVYNGVAEESLVVTGIDNATALNIGNQFQQESIFSSKDGLMFGDGSVVPLNGDVSKGPDARKKDSLTIMNVGGRKSSIHTGLNWGNMSYGKNFNSDNIHRLDESDPNYDSELFQGLTDSRKRALGFAFKLLNSIGGLNVTIVRNSKAMEGQLEALGYDTANRNASFFRGADKTIYVNLETVRGNTLFHEIVHPMVDFIKKTDPELYKRIEGEVSQGRVKRRVLKNGRKVKGSYLQWAEENYADLSKEGQIEEAFAEMMGDAAYGHFNKSQSTLNRILDIVRAMLGKLNITTNKENPAAINLDEMSLSDMRKNLAGALVDGRKINVGGIEFEVGEVKVDKDKVNNSIRTQVDKSEPNSDLGVVNVNIPDNVQTQEIRFQTPEYYPNFDISKVKRGSIKEFNGQKALLMLTDRSASGMVVSPTGVKHEFDGGVFYPYQEDTGVWAFSDKSAATRMINAAKESDGLVFLTAMAPGSIDGSVNMFDYVMKELDQAIKDKRATKKEVLDFLNKKMTIKSFDSKVKGEGIKTAKVKSVKEFSNLVLSMPQAFGVRKDIIRKSIQSKIFEKWGVPSMQEMYDIVNQDIVKNLKGNPIVSAIRIDTEAGYVDSRTDESIKDHPTYPYVVKGEPLMIFDESIDASEVWDELNLADKFLIDSKTGEKLSEGQTQSRRQRKIEMARPVVDIRMQAPEIKIPETRYNDPKEIKRIGFETGGIAHIPTGFMLNFLHTGENRVKQYAGEKIDLDIKNLREEYKKEGIDVSKGTEYMPDRVEAINIIKQSIQEKGFEEIKGTVNEGVILLEIDSNGFAKIGQGNHRLLAAKSLGMDKVPVSVQFTGFYDNTPRVNKIKVISEEKMSELESIAKKRNYHTKYASIWLTDLVKDNFIENNPVDLNKNLEGGYSLNQILNRFKDKRTGLRFQAPTYDMEYTPNALVSLAMLSDNNRQPEQWVKEISKGLKGASRDVDTMGLLGLLKAYKKDAKVKSIPKEMVERIIATNMAQIETTILDEETFTVYDQSTLPGGKNYREFLINDISPEEIFSAPHYGGLGQNLIASARVDDRVGPNGEKVLFVQEIQSDWVQGVNKDFFDTAENINNINSKIAESFDRIDVLGGERTNIYSQASMEGRPLLESERKRIAEIEDDIDLDNRLIENLQVKRKVLKPYLPWNQTDLWVGLTIRKLINQASKEGYDQIAFVNGEQSDIIQGHSDGRTAEFYNKIVPKNINNELKRLVKGMKSDVVNYGEEAIKIVESGVALERMNFINQQAAAPLGAQAYKSPNTVINLTPELKAATDKVGPLRFQVAGERASLSEKIQDNLIIANEMEELNQDDKLFIKRATGWERGADGKWRYELEPIKFREDIISLSDGKPDFTKFKRTTKEQEDDWLGPFEGDYVAKLKDIIDAKDLFEAYGEKKKNPNEKSIIKFYKAVPDLDIFLRPSRSEGGLYRALNQAITVEYTKNTSKKEILEIITHEVQHHIQQIEGFSEGQTFTKQYYRGKPTKSYLEYFRSAGEVEARNVETRMSMDPVRRKNTLLSLTEDVAREDQIRLQAPQEEGEANVYTSGLATIAWEVSKFVVDKDYQLGTYLSNIKNKELRYDARMSDLIFRPHGTHTNQEIKEIMVRSKGEVNAELLKTSMIVEEVKAANKEANLSREEVDRLLHNLEEVKAMEDSDLKVALIKMREHIDSLSRTLIREGLVNGKTQFTIDENLGVYVNRSYKQFEVEGWKQTDNDIIRKAKSFLYAEIKAQNEKDVEAGKVDKDGELIALMTDKDMTAKVEAEYKKLISKEGFRYASGKSTQSDNLTMVQSIFKRRKNVPVEIRDLWGEIDNPYYNYVTSVNQISRTIAAQRMFRELNFIGEGKFISKDATDFADNELLGAKYGDLEGMYVDNEMYAVLNKSVENLNNPEWLNLYLTAVLFNKKMKTVWNIGTHAKNIIGNTSFATMNGHIGFNGDMYKNISTSLKAFKSMKEGEFADLYSELTRLGVVSSSASLQEIREIANDIQMSKFDLTEYLDENRGPIGKRMAKTSRFFKEGVTGLDNMLTKAYQAEDDMFKIFGFLSEKQRYIKAGIDPVTAKDMAARNIINLYPNYNEIPGFIRKLGRSPVVGSFVAFQAEAVRNTKNAVKLGFEELGSSNPKIRKIGATRVAGTISVFALIESLQMATIQALGGALGFTGGDEEELEDRAIRLLLPEWDSTGKLATVERGRLESRQAEGQSEPDKYFDYVNLSNTSGVGYIKDIMRLAFTDIDSELGKEEFDDTVMNILEDVYKPFLGEEMTLIAFREAIDNRGKKVYSPTDSWYEKLGKIMLYAGKKIQPGITKTAYRNIESRWDSDSELVPEYEALAVLGLRVSRINVNKGLAIKSRFLVNDMNDIVGKATMRNKMDIINAYTQNSKFNGFIDEMADLYSTARLNQVAGIDIENILRKSGISEKMLDIVRTRYYNNYSEDVINVDETYGFDK